MQLVNEFNVPLPPEQAWPILVDLERIAPCIPGAKITGVDGDVYEGRAKIKVGPITIEYKGTATFAERDDAAHRAVIAASARDIRGQGGVSAKVAASLSPEGTGSKVTVNTEMDLSGKVAQFGRGVIEDTSSVLLRRFADSLAEEMSGGQQAAEGSGDAGTATASSAAVTSGSSQGTPTSVVPRSKASNDEVLDVMALAKEARKERAGGDGRTNTVLDTNLTLLVSLGAAVISVFAAGVAVGVATHGLRR